MTTTLAVAPVQFDPEQIALIKRQIAVGATAAKASGAEVEVVFKTTKYGRDVVALRDPNAAEPLL